MNIEEAKNEIRNALKIYLIKNDYGEYEVPPSRQRPIMVLGAPGIGKTSIMEQLASELDLGLVSYTITHHTRQSAIGLPYIAKRNYDGKEQMVTEYTMSEIITSVYDAIEKQGKKEGILFIDEINCVSETLAPAMLDLLQNKKFGPHKIPSGWILVSAGNPPEYNRSAREFDVVTLDRLKVLNVEPDFDIWLKYAYKNLVHPAVIYYLSLKKQNLFKSEKIVGGYSYITPRGWDDLSTAMLKYEKLGLEITLTLIEQYIADKKTSSEFFNYLILFTKYRADYNVADVMEGRGNDLAVRLTDSKFDEKLGVVSVFSNAINTLSEGFMLSEEVIRIFKNAHLKQKKEGLSDFEIREELFNSSFETKEGEFYNVRVKEALRKRINLWIFSEKSLKNYLQSLEQELKEGQIKLRKSVENLFVFLDRYFGKGQEMVAFVLNLLASPYFVHYISYYPCPIFFDYNELLLIDRQNKLLLEEIARYKSLK